ncbi:RnfABCDGE type electron transport complex subunit G [bacterium]|nr:RnfABCDGE type electron transport complex subunit G [bacterium]
MAKGKNKNSSIKIMQNKFYPVIFLAIIVLVAVVLLMYVNNITRAKILEQREAKIVNQLKNIFPDVDKYEFKDDIYIILKDNKSIGYAFIAKGKGYGGEIQTLVGIDKDFAVKEITVMSNSETPGLGSKITLSSFTGQFKGLKSSEVVLSKDGGQVDAITGATISSRAVTDSVRKELDKKIEIIKKNNY